MNFNFLGFNVTRQKSAPTSEAVVRPSNALAVTSDPFAAGSSLGSGSTPIHTLVQRLATTDIDLSTELHLRHIIRDNLSDVSTALLYRRALEGDLVINSKDAGLQDELREWSKQIPIGYINGAGSATGLNLYLDIMGDTADEYGPAIGEKQFKGRRIERLFTPDMRTFDLEKHDGGVRLVQIQDGVRVPIEGGTIHSLVWKGSSSKRWPPAMIDGGVLPAEALLRMIISLNTIWLKAGDPPMMYTIEYDKDAPVPNSTFTLPDGQVVKADNNLQQLYGAIKQVKQARRRGMSAEIVLSVTGGEIKAEPVFGNQTTAGLVKEAEPHFRIASGLISQLSQVPSWIFASGNNKAEGIGSNRANAEASVAFAAAERRRRKLMPIARDILNAHILAERSPGSVNNFTFEWTAPSIVNEEIIERTRRETSAADANFVRTSFELYNPEGADINDEQREYLTRRGVLVEEVPE